MIAAPPISYTRAKNRLAPLLLGLCFWALLPACTKARYEEPQPGPATATTITYPLDVVFTEGFTGSLTLTRLEDGTASARLSLSGMRQGKVYYANLSRGASSFLGAAPLYADLNAIGPEGTSTTWLFEDYLNQPIRYDSLLIADLMVKVLEVTPGSTRNQEVLRGDIGSNILGPEQRSFTLGAVGGSGVSGTLTLRARLNGNWLAITELRGLSPTAFVPVSLRLGSPDSAYAGAPLAALNPVSGATGTARSEIPGLPGGLPALDSFNGFFGVALSAGRPDSLLAVAALGPNAPTGQAAVYTLYAPDSAAAATLTFTRYRSGAWRASVTAGPLAGIGPFFLTLHRGTAFSGPRALAVWPGAIAPNATTRLPALSLNGQSLSPSYIDTAGLHLRITEDTVTYAGSAAVADVGRHALTGQARFVALQTWSASLYPGFTGQAALRQRRDGSVLGQLIMARTETFFDHVLNLRQGSFAPGGSQGTLVAQLASVPGGNGSGASILFEPKDTQNNPLPYTALTPARYLELEEEASSGQPLAGGNIN